jgi:hypothetical protein
MHQTNQTYIRSVNSDLEYTICYMPPPLLSTNVLVLSHIIQTKQHSYSFIRRPYHNRLNVAHHVISTERKQNGTSLHTDTPCIAPINKRITYS